MMQEREFVFGWDPKSSKRSSGLFSVLKWFGNKESVTPPPPDIISSSSSCESIESVFSTDTVASFNFVPPSAYRPFGTASVAEKFILSGPETSTYRARLAQREVSLESDRNLTLRSKYNLYKGQEIDRVHSLPLTKSVEQRVMHRRTASESSKHRRAGAYCHVKGKRKAPQPPGSKLENTLRRKKRMAPQPPNPDVIANDSLKLDRGILKPAKNQAGVSKVAAVQEVAQVAPRPWYKRTLSKHSNVEKKEEKHEKHDKHAEKHSDKHEKRKSGLSFLTNISELDREAMEILEQETLKLKYLNQSQAPAFMRPRVTEHTRTNSDSWLSPKRKSAKDLIARFNAITGVSRVTNFGSKESIKEQSASPQIKENKPEFVIQVVQEVTPSTSQVLTKENLKEEKKQLPNSPVARTTAVVKPISRSQWNCPRCTLENDYWRIICRVCSTIKPYFDDFTTVANPTNENKTESEESRADKKDTNDILGLSGTEMRISDLQRSIFQSQYPKLSLNVDLKPVNEKKESETPKVSETRNIFQSQYPKVSLNPDFKTENVVDKNKDPKPSESRSIFNAQYPKINLNINKEIELINESSTSKLESSNSENKSRMGLFDFGFDKPKKEETTKVENNNDVSIEIKKNDNQLTKEQERKIEKMILGDELNFKEPENSVRDEIKPELKKQEKAEGTKIEKMILGDEINVERPEYVNVNRYEKVDIKNADIKNKQQGNGNLPKVEKMILGDEISVKKSHQTEPKIEQLDLTKSSDTKKSDNGAISKIKIIKTKEQTDEEKQNSAKKEEREKLKKMLIEMKNSLPKRSNKSSEQKHRVSLIQEQSETEIEDDSPKEKTAEVIIATTETIYENIKIRKTDVPKAVKVSSSAQTHAVLRRNITSNEISDIKQSNSGFQLIGAKDFVGISNEKTGNTSKSAENTSTSAENTSTSAENTPKSAEISENLEDGPHTYANLNVNSSTSEKHETVLPNLFAGRSKTDTLEINRLLRRLETAIVGGELGQAAVFARELAQLKVPLSVIRQKSEDGVDKLKENAQLFNVDMYVEDKISHRGPFPLQVSAIMSVADLKALVEEKYKIPRGVQRWILGKQLATKDNATLGDHEIISGCPIFLYLVAPANDTKTDQNVLEIIEIEDLERLPTQETKIPKTSYIQPEIQPVAIVEEEDFSDDEVIDEALNEAIIEEPEDQIEDQYQDLWKCRACTLLNPLVTKECEVCGLIREEEEVIGEEAATDNQTYLQLVNLDNEDLVRNVEPFECLVCLVDCPIGEGVTLRECLHQFCRACLAHTVEFSDEAEVKCPYRDNQYACDITLQDREIKALVSAVVYEQHLAKSVKQAENKIDNAFHCKTPDCKGWCIFEDNVNDFRCPVCRKSNCLTCQAIHDGMNCKQYQEQMKTQSETDEDARRTRDFLEDMIKRGEALACPTCQVVLLKKWGCDWLRCSMCKTEICWVTRGPRWGPGGKGDITGGCKCGVNGLKCHPKCNYCH